MSALPVEVEERDGGTCGFKRGFSRSAKSGHVIATAGLVGGFIRTPLEPAVQPGVIRNDRRVVGFGRDAGRRAATASTACNGRLGFASGSEVGLEEWPDSFSSDAMSTFDGDGVSSSQFRADFPLGLSVATRLGRYQVLGLLGEGRYAQVYRGYDPILERAVALKVNRPGMRPLGEMKEQFLGEARALARVRHPAIVPVYELGCIDDRCFIVMALIEGHSLAELRRAESPIDRLPPCRGDRRRPRRGRGLRPRPGDSPPRHQAGQRPLR